MDEGEKRQARRTIAVTSEMLRNAAADAELRGDWNDVDLLHSAADRIIQLEAQNQAYRHALAGGVSINMIGKRRWFKVND